MKLGLNRDGLRRWSFAELYIYDLIERYQYDDKILLSIKDIMAISGHSRQRINFVVKKLEREGHIEKVRRFNPEDCRRNYYYVWVSSFDPDEYNYIK